MKWPRQISSWFRSPWIGLVGGVISWYAAHEIGFFLAGNDCTLRWILKTVHVIAFLVAIICVRLSAQAVNRLKTDAEPPTKLTIAFVSLGAAVLFAIVILWQTLATFFYSGCER